MRLASHINAGLESGTGKNKHVCLHGVCAVCCLRVWLSVSDVVFLSKCLPLCCVLSVLLSVVMAVTLPVLYLSV